MRFFRRNRVVIVVLGLGILVAILVGYRVKKQQAMAVPRRQVEIVVGVTKPVRKDLDVKLAYTADVLPNKQVAIFPKVSGYIVRLGAELGDFVRAGQLLVEIEAQELNAAVEQARAAVGTAEANLKVAESNVEAARASYATQEANVVRARAVADNDGRNANRLEDLATRGLIAAMERDNTRTNAEASRAALARSTIERERASLKIAQTNLDNTRVTAPFPGYISARNLHPGAAVSSQAAGTSNSSVGILVLQDLAIVKVQLEIQERDISRVRVGSTARVLVDAYPTKTFEARATRIVHALDPRSRTLGVEMEIANPELLLKPGMSRGWSW